MCGEFKKTFKLTVLGVSRDRKRIICTGESPGNVKFALHRVRRRIQRVTRSLSIITHKQTLLVDGQRSPFMTLSQLQGGKFLLRSQLRVMTK